MIVEKTAAKKTLAVTLALALFASAPVSAWAQVRAASVSATASLAAGGSAASAAPKLITVGAPLTMPLAPSAAMTPALSPALVAPAAAPVAAAPAAVEAHPVIAVLNQLQAKGVSLPDTLSTREDADKLIAAAQAMPEGTARRDMIQLAEAIRAANGAPSDAKLGKVYDAEEARAESGSAPVAVTGWRAALSRAAGRLLGRATPKGEEPAKAPAQPANREDFAVKLADLRYAPSASQLPESTAQVEPGPKKVVGQDEALKAMKFGLKMPGRHYNMFVSGPNASGRETALRLMLPEVAASMPNPGDIVAATNFGDKDEPVFLNLPAGRGPAFAMGVKKFVAMLKQTLPEALNSGELAQAKKKAMAQVQQAAEERQEAFDAEVAAISMPGGFGAKFFADDMGDGKMFVGLTLTHGGQAIEVDKVDADIAAGKYTRSQLDAAKKELSKKQDAIMEKFQSMMQQNQQEESQITQQIAILEKQAAAGIVSQVGQSLIGLVMPRVEPSAEVKAALEAKQAAAFEALSEALKAVSADGFGIVARDTGEGLAFVPTKDGEPMTAEKLSAMVESGQTTVEKFKAAQKKLMLAAKPHLEAFKAAMAAVQAEAKTLGGSKSEVKLTAEQAKAVNYVKTLVGFAAQNHEIFMGKIGSPADEDGEGGLREAPGQKPMDAQDFFEISVLASNGGAKGAPVVWVANPTYENVFGEAEDNRRMMIIPGVGMVKGGAPGGPSFKGGAIHKAQGGFLVMNVMDVLREPGVWQALMHAVRTGEAEIAEGGIRGLMMGKGSTYHFPSKVKIVLIGSPSLRMMLSHYDEDFAMNFQAPVEFEPSIRVSEEAVAGYVRFFKDAVTALAYELKQGVVDLTQGAMSALVEQGSRLGGGNTKLTAQLGVLYTLIREATFWAQSEGRKEVRREDVETALREKQNREEVYRRHLLDVYKKNVFVVETSGSKVGQINGLAVMGSFGVPMRVTVVASRAAGMGGIVSVDRQASPTQTGPTFNKALGVVEGFLQNMFAQKKAFPVRLTISYEQNYGGIDGDSATSTEIYSILSALSGVPIGQNYAVTGSADQFGNVQAIGGVNEKIEGFFELCKARGLTGDQGIVIPQSNVADLQLTPEVVEAVKKGLFHIYAVSHVSQGLEVLTGVAYQTIVDKARARVDAMNAPEGKAEAKK